MNYLDANTKIETSGGDFSVPQAKSLSRILAGEIKVKIPYTPRPVFQPYHSRKQRWAIIVAHRRAGKTVAEVNEGIRKIASIKRKFPVPQVAFVSPTYSQGKRNAWQYAKYYTRNIPGIKVSEAELTITFPNGGRYLFVGSDNYDSLKGIYLDHASLDEYALQDPQVWGLVIRHTLSDRKGSATFISSANGRDHLYDLLKLHENDPDWYISILKASKTGILDQAELDDARKTVSESQYAQEYECSFDAAVTGAYYGKDIVLAEDEGRVTDLHYDRAAKVYCGWDLGMADHTALWTFQLIGQEWRFLNYYSNYNQDLTHYTRWLSTLPYEVDLHFLPHDAKQKSLQTSKTVYEFLDGLDLNCEMVPKVPSVNDRIAAVRMVLNRCWFDKKGTATGNQSGLDCLRMYESEFNEENKVLALRPKHNWASHGADAFGTCVMGIEEKLKKLRGNEEKASYRGEGAWMG